MPAEQGLQMPAAWVHSSCKLSWAAAAGNAEPLSSLQCQP